MSGEFKMAARPWVTVLCWSASTKSPMSVKRQPLPHALFIPGINLCLEWWLVSRTKCTVHMCQRRMMIRSLKPHSEVLKDAHGRICTVNVLLIILYVWQNTEANKTILAPWWNYLVKWHVFDTAWVKHTVSCYFLLLNLWRCSWCWTVYSGIRLLQEWQETRLYCWKTSYIKAFEYRQWSESTLSKALNKYKNTVITINRPIATPNIYLFEHV